MRRTPGTVLLAAALVLPMAPAAVAAPAATAPATTAGSQVLARDGGSPPPTLTALAARTRVSTAAANARIAQVLATRTSSRILGARFTMTVWDPATASWVYQRRAGASLRGASTTKILTAVGVLATLGPEHRFPTTVRAGAAPGEVVLVAGGDPLLTSADLRRLAADTARALRAAPAATSGEAVPAASPAASPTVDPSPSATPPQPAVVVRADDALFGDRQWRSRGWPRHYVPAQVRMVGAFARDDRKVRDATADAGAFFASALRAEGVEARYGGEGVAPAEAPTLATFAGHSVAQAVSRTLLVSDNDTAEMLFRQVAVARGLPATWAGARQALAATLTELGVPLAGVRIVDGSGLSLDGRLTAPALTAALARALDPAHPRLAGLRGWLPVAGRTGTLRSGDKRFHARPARCAAGLIQAKTGTVADAIGLAGYAAGADGSTKVFVGIVNSRPTRYTRAQTRIAVDRAASSVTGCW
ncbi:MAG: D-alanyl-D-alanine carboxypeptidase [Candidatus Nanopelagicales bacterium]|jgi:D-alanyl-D-alanine carboxypeptidase/D-alanyl-D-alanine-endopeptidase (penicillin-binding protein 4)|nr:D-alanyl-D-alanine carboxypeptidase [Candidatus Nanopelagicales bacterium]